MHRLVAWCSTHKLTAHEVIQGPLLAWWLFVLVTAHQSWNQSNQSPLYREMVHLAPIWIWAGTLAVILLALLIGMTFRVRAALYASLLGKAAWWSVIASLTYHVSGSWLGPSAYIVFCLAAVLRYGELSTETTTRP